MSICTSPYAFQKSRFACSSSSYNTSEVFAKIDNLFIQQTTFYGKCFKTGNNLRQIAFYSYS